MEPTELEALELEHPLRATSTTGGSRTVGNQQHGKGKRWHSFENLNCDQRFFQLIVRVFDGLFDQIA